ncbi:MAG: cyclic nucleotide-binding protein [Eubacterium sp.]|nr:cyclic nucleotide-binding protein [Eubacterium sp.]
MVKLESSELIDKYVDRYGIGTIFTKDMRPFMELLFFKKNEFICREGDEIDYLYFIVDGKSKVFTTVSNGKALLLCFYHALKIIGDVEVVGSKTASSNVQVIEDTYCIGIAKENVSKYLLEDAKFLKYMCNSLGQKLNRCSKNSAINLLYSLENRLASFILAAGEVTDIKGQKVVTLNENLSELSELLGTSYRHLHRTLNDLCEKGIIKKTGFSYEVLDQAAIKRLAADLYS